MDETGVLANDPQQPFFALGMLKLEKTAHLYRKLSLINDRAISALGSQFEFKFNRINKNNKKFYLDFVDAFFSTGGLFFQALVIDKTHPRFDMNKHFPNTWEAQIAYTQHMMRHTVQSNEQVAVVADFLSKPKASNMFFEEEVPKTKYPHDPSASPVFNACMLESHASLLIQLVDVLLGLTLYDCKINKGIAPGNSAKIEVLERLKKQLGCTNFLHSRGFPGPPYFGVWFFDPS